MVVRQAAMFAMREHRNISISDLEQSINIIKPTLTDSIVESYKLKGEQL